MRHHRSLSLAALGLLVAALCATTAAAEDCSGFKWPVDTEVGWLKAGGDIELKSGAEIAEAPAKAITLELEPAKSASLAATPGVKAQAIGADAYSGWFKIGGGLKPGLYKVSLSTNGWIDVVQGGALIPSHGFSGQRECTVIHKSVRYEIGAGPVVVQIAGAPQQRVRLTVSPAN